MKLNWMCVSYIGSDHVTENHSMFLTKPLFKKHTQRFKLFLKRFYFFKMNPTQNTANTEAILSFKLP